MTAPSRAGRSFVLYVALAALFAVSIAYQLPLTKSRFDELTRGETIADFPLDLDFPRFEVVTAEAADIRCVGSPPIIATMSPRRNA